MALFFLSGASGLIYQVVWVRMLTLIFSVTAFAVSTVVSAFMAGLALGSYIFGRRVDKSRHPLKLYAWLEIGIFLYAIASPLIFSAVDRLYILIYQTFSPAYALFALIRFVIAFIVILIPTLFMGGTLPILSKILTGHRSRIGRVAGYLYSINTAGAVLGTFMAGFFLIKLLGVNLTIALAAAINLLIGLAALVLWRTGLEKTGRDAAGARPGKTVISGSERRTQRLILWAFALSGLASLAYEVIWTRALLYFLGLTTYTFTTILTTFLVGIAAGSWVFSRFIDQKRNLLIWFASLEILIGITAFAVTPLIEVLYSFSDTLRNWLGYYSWWGNVGVRFVLASAFMLLPTFFMGATFPTAVRCYSRELKALGGDIGRVYSVNTIGSILGSFLAGFLFIPLLGLRLSMTLVTLINIAIGLSLLLLHPRLGAKKRYYALAAAAVVLLLIALNMSPAPVVLTSVKFKGVSQRYDLLYYKEGVDASVAVLEDRITGERELNINGESTAFTIYQDMQVHKLLGHLPLLLHPDPRSTLIIGFGLGSTAWATVQYPQVETDCVELVRDEIETAPFFDHENHNVLEHPRFNLIIGDGRDYIKATDKKYDMISVNAIHPKISPNLYTLDFYRLCQRILSDDGMMIAWLPPNAITEREYQSLIKTFIEIFPNSSLWYVNPSHMLLLSSPGPLKIDYSLYRGRLSREGVGKDLEDVNLDDPLELLSCFLLAGEDLVNYCREAPVNSDDKPYIEFSREATITVNLGFINSLEKTRRSVWPHLTGVEGDSLQLRDNLAKIENAKSHVIRGQVLAWIGRYDEAREQYRLALEIDPGNRNAGYLLGLIQRRKEELLKLTELNPGNARAVQALGEIYLREGRLGEAHDAFSRAVRLDPDYAQARHHLGLIHYYQKKPATALAEFQKARDLDPQYGAAYFYAGLCLWQMGRLDESIYNFEASVQLDPNIAPAHFQLALAYQRKGRIREAAAELEEVLRIDPQHRGALEMLHRLQSGSPN